MYGKLESLNAVGVVGRESVQVPEPTQAALNVGHMDLHVVLKAAGIGTIN